MKDTTIISYLVATFIAIGVGILGVFSYSYVASYIYNDSYIFATLPRYNTYHFVPLFLFIHLFLKGFKLKEKKEEKEKDELEYAKLIGTSIFNYLFSPWTTLLFYQLIKFLF